MKHGGDCAKRKAEMKIGGASAYSRDGIRQDEEIADSIGHFHC
jgi:hypothetical protein